MRLRTGDTLKTSKGDFHEYRQQISSKLLRLLSANAATREKALDQGCGSGAHGIVVHFLFRPAGKHLPVCRPRQLAPTQTTVKATSISSFAQSCISGVKPPLRSFERMSGKPVLHMVTLAIKRGLAKTRNVSKSKMSTARFLAIATAGGVTNSTNSTTWSKKHSR